MNDRRGAFASTAFSSGTGCGASQKRRRIRRVVVAGVVVDGVVGVVPDRPEPRPRRLRDEQSRERGECHRHRRDDERRPEPRRPRGPRSLVLCLAADRDPHRGRPGEGADATHGAQDAQRRGARARGKALGAEQIERVPAAHGERVEQRRAEHERDPPVRSSRIAVVKGHLKMRPETLVMITEGAAKKGDVLGVARLAGIMGAKQTANLIPLCHPLGLDHVHLDLVPDHSLPGILITATCAVSGPTGVEMEAMTAVSTAALTVYDMCKAVDRGMEIGGIRLTHKSGGKSGAYDAS